MGASGSRGFIDRSISRMVWQLSQGDNQPMVLGCQSRPNGRPESSQGPSGQTRVEFLDRRKGIG
jgi:hypothetical protein